jgi:ribose 5-phosphate isomerase B
MKRRTLLQAGLAGAALVAAGATAKAQSESKTTKETPMDIVIAADPFAVDLKDAVVEHLKEKGHTVLDVGATKDNQLAYYDCAPTAAKAVQEGKAKRGILFCGTGAGMAIVANKFKGVNAVCVESVFAARMARSINDSNVLTMGAMIVAPWMANEMIDAWLETKHTEGLEQFSDFLKDALGKVDDINQAQCK